MDELALKALYVAAAALTATHGISNVSVDNDHKGGEILFEVSEQTYRLKLEEVDA